MLREDAPSRFTVEKVMNLEYNPASVGGLTRAVTFEHVSWILEGAEARESLLESEEAVENVQKVSVSCSRMGGVTRCCWIHD